MYNSNNNAAQVNRFGHPSALYYQRVNSTQYFYSPAMLRQKSPNLQNYQNKQCTLLFCKTSKGQPTTSYTFELQPKDISKCSIEENFELSDFTGMNLDECSIFFSRKKPIQQNKAFVFGNMELTQNWYMQIQNQKKEYDEKIQLQKPMLIQIIKMDDPQSEEIKEKYPQNTIVSLASQSRVEISSKKMNQSVLLLESQPSVSENFEIIAQNSLRFGNSQRGFGKIVKNKPKDANQQNGCNIQRQKVESIQQENEQSENEDSFINDIQELDFEKSRDSFIDFHSVFMNQ